VLSKGISCFTGERLLCYRRLNLYAPPQEPGFDIRLQKCCGQEFIAAREVLRAFYYACGDENIRADALVDGWNTTGFSIG